MVCSNLEWDIISHFREKGLLILIQSSSEKPPSKLSENHKINVIGPTELKLLCTVITYLS